MSSIPDRGGALLRDIDDWLLPEIGANNATALRFIIRRTYMMGRYEWGITIDEFVNGVVIGEKRICLGVGFGATTVKKCLRELDNHYRLIFRGKKHFGSFVHINELSVDEDSFDSLVDRSKRMARKRGTDRGQIPTTRWSESDHSVVRFRPAPRGREEPKGRKTEGTALAPDSTLEAIEQGTRKYTEGTARRLKKHSKKAGPPSMTAINDYLKVLISRHGLQSIAPLTQKDYGVFKKHYLASPEPYHKILDWAVPHWGTVRDNHFDYDRKFPMIPTLRYIAYNWRRLLDAYREDMRNAGDYLAADERKATRIQKDAEAIAAEKRKADEALAQAEREKEEKDRQIKDLRSRLGDDKPFNESVFKKLYHYDD